MKKLMKFLLLFDVLLLLVIFGTIMADKQMLSNDVIRLHVVANSDSSEDQSVKLKVRDAIINYLEPQMQLLSDSNVAMTYLENDLESICQAANNALASQGSDLQAKVTLCKEKFPVRHYDTFSLPSGVYQSLRVTIGSGDGQNWWCVVFPSLCIPASSTNVETCAVDSGFSNELTSAITKKDGYEIRFFVLDVLGKLENLFF